MNIDSDENDLFCEAMNGTIPLKSETRQPTQRKKHQSNLAKRPNIPINNFEHHEVTVPYCNAEYLESVGSDQQLFYAKAGLQTRIIRKLRKGQFSIEAELDLHGLTVDEAYTEVESFLNDCQRRQKRYLCIIHGKGLHSSDGKTTLKSMVNSWLRQLDVVLAFCSAQSKDGGAGAIYLLLKFASKE